MPLPTAVRVLSLSVIMLCAEVHAARGQGTIALTAGTSPSVQVASGARIGVPIVIDMSGATGGANLASITSVARWGQSRLMLDSVTAGVFGTLTSNLANSGNGSATVSLFSGVGTSSTLTMGTLWFTASGATGGTRVLLDPVVAADALGATVLPILSTRAQDVCVITPGSWGDASGDNLVNIIDAQQIARFSVGLPVSNAVVLAARGDVNGDNAVNIIDAQQIARYSVGLNAAQRVNTAIYVPPTVASVTIVQGASAIGAGLRAQFIAVPRDANGVDLTGCVAIAWSSSDNTRATVSPYGEVAGVSAGSPTITASAGGHSAPFVTSVVAPVSGGTLSVNAGDGQVANAGSAVAVAPSVQFRDAANAPVVGAAVSFTVTSGGGSVTGASTLTNASGIATVGSWTIGAVQGTNSLTATASGAGVTGNPVVFTATSTATPAIAVSVSASAFSGMIGNPDPQPFPVLISNQGSGALNGLGATVAYAGGQASGWLTASLNATTAPATMTLTPTMNGLAAGTYNATVSVASSSQGVSNSPQTVAVTLTVVPRSLIPVQLVVTPVPVIAAGSIVVTVSATPNAGDPLTIMRLAVTGLVTVSDSLVLTTAGSGTFSRAIALPLDVGTATIVASVVSRAGSVGSTETSIVAADTRGPTIGGTLVNKATVPAQPGDTIKMSLTASDDISMKYTLLRITGAFSGIDSVGYQSRTPSVNRLASIVVPRTATLGGTIQIVAETMDIGGNVMRSNAIFMTINDIVAPVVTSQLTGARPNGSYAPGSTATVTVGASDNVGLRYIGAAVQGLGIRDSTSASGSSGQFTLTVPIPASTVGSFPVSVFAYDVVNNRTEYLTGVLTVDTRARRAMVSAPMPAIRDLVIDSKRGVVYASQPDSSRVMVMAMGSGAVQQPLIVPGQPAGIDLTLGGDTLIAALRNTSVLSASNLVTGIVTTMPVATANYLQQYPDNVRVAANNRAIYSLTFGGSGYGGTVRDLDLVTGVSVNSVSVTEATPMAVSGNRQRVLSLIDDSCCSESAFFYDASTGSFSAQKGTVNRYGPGVASDYLGNTVLIGTETFNGALAFLKAVHANGSVANAVALSPDGLTAYVSTSTGVARVRISDDTVLETFNLGAQPTHMRISTDGLTLAVSTTAAVFVIDLW